MRQLFAGLVIAAAGLAVAADDKPATPTGTWVRDADTLEIRIRYAPKNEVKITVSAGDNAAIVSGKYTRDKDTIRVEVTGVEEKGEFPAKPSKGDKFWFKWKAGEKTATLTDYEGAHAEGGKQIVEGEYKKVEEKETDEKKAE